MVMSKWLDGKPDIRNGLMVVGQYDPVYDNTLFYDVYNYPNLNYVGRFNSSRFDRQRTCESYPPPDNKGFHTVGEFRIWRELYPNVLDSNQWLEVLHWGHPDLITKPGGPPSHTYVYSIVNFQPVPFEKLVNNILDLKFEYND
jgi:hypothetical protein